MKKCHLPAGTKPGTSGNQGPEGAGTKGRFYEGNRPGAPGSLVGR